MQRPGPGAYIMKPDTKKIMRKWDVKFYEMAEKLKSLGFSNKDLGFFLGNVSTSTIKDWMKKKPKLKLAIEAGREVARKKLIASGLKAAWGYDYEESNEKFTPDESGTLVLKERSVFHKHKPPDTKLMLTFLAVLDPEFRHVYQRASEGVNKNITLKIDGKLESKKMQELAGRLLEVDTEGLGRKSIISEQVGSGTSE